MKVELTSKFDVGDMVAHVGEDKYSPTGETIGVGPVVEVKYGSIGGYTGFYYYVQGDHGERWGAFREYEIRAARPGEKSGSV